MISILDSSNLVKKVAVVDSKNKIVALGDDTNAALQELKKLPEAVLRGRGF